MNACIHRHADQVVLFEAGDRGLEQRLRPEPLGASHTRQAKMRGLDVGVAAFARGSCSYASNRIDAATTSGSTIRPSAT